MRNKTADHIAKRAMATLVLLRPADFKPEQVAHCADWVLDHVGGNEDLPLRDAAMRYYDENVEALYA